MGGPTTANTAPIFEGGINNKGVQFTSGDGTSKKTIFTAGNYGSRIDSVSLCSNDTAIVGLNFYINDLTNDYYLGTVSVAAGAGYTSIAKQDALPTLAPTGTNLARAGFIALPSGWLLKAACTATMTFAKTGDIVAFGGDF